MPLPVPRLPIPLLPGPLPRIPWLRGALAWMILGTYVALGEVNGLLDQVLLPGGRTTSPTSLTGPGAPFAWGETVSDWQSLLQSRTDLPTHAWITTYAALDLCFIALYGTVGLLLRRRARVRSIELTPTGEATWERSARWTRVGSVVLLAAAVDVTENAAMLIALKASEAATVLPGITALKWVLILGASVLAVRAHNEDRRTRWELGLAPARVAVGWAKAAYAQRFSLLIVLPLALLGLGKGPDLLEQIPDIERRWAEQGGWAHLLWASVATVLVAGTIFVLGRMRSHNIVMRAIAKVPDPHTKPVLWLWWASPVAVLLLAGLADARGLSPTWSRVALFASVPTVIAAVSTTVRWVNYTFSPDATGRVTTSTDLPKWLYRATKPSASIEQAQRAIALGDGLAIALFMLPGVGLIRAFAGEVALGDRPAMAWGLLALGIVICVVGWPIAAFAIDRLNHASSAPMPARRVWAATLRILTPGLTTSRQWLAPVLLGILALAAIPFGWYAADVSQILGPITTFLVGVTIISGLVGTVVVILQQGGAPEFFWLPLVRRASAPVTTLLILATILGTVRGGGDDVHGIRTLPDFVPTHRHSWSQVLANWARANTCDIPLPDTNYNVRPLFVYAAEGGGIRAAVWTSLALDTLASMGPPGCTTALMSSGASGGAVGLAVASVLPPGHAAEATKRMSGPEALSVATVGLTVTDIVYAATGVPIPARVENEWRWLDRAGQMEMAWERAVPKLKDPYLGTAAPSGITGALVLNSTSATNRCRALVSQVELGGTDDLAKDNDSKSPLDDCTARGRSPGSLDVVRLTDACGISLSTSAAAMLAARFPFVTPSAALCSAAAKQQLVDGGYIENTGVGTVADLAPQWLPLVRTHNSRIVSRGSGTLWAPVLVYFDNGRGSDLAARPSSRTQEFLVPPKTVLGGTKVLFGADAQLRRVQQLFAADQLFAGRGSVAAIDAVNKWRPTTTYVAYQATAPSTSAPLGWVLSEASYKALERAAKNQPRLARKGDTPADQSPASGLGVMQEKGYGSLTDLGSLFGE